MTHDLAPGHPGPESVDIESAGARSAGISRPASVRPPPSPRYRPSPSYRVAALAGLLVLMAGLVVVALLADATRTRGVEEERLAVLSDLGTIRARLERSLAIASHRGEGLIADIALSGDITQERFDRFARDILVDPGVLRHVGLSQGLVVRYIHPLAGNEAALGLDYATIPQQMVGIQQAIDSRSAVMVGPTTLAQGSQALVIRRPVFLSPPDQLPRTGPFWGILSLVLDLDKLLGDAGLLNPDSPLEIALRNSDAIAGEPVMIHGRADLFDTAARVSLNVTIPHSRWDLTARPRQGWGKLHDDQVGAIWIGGLVLSLLLASLTFAGIRLIAARRSIEDGLLEARQRADSALDALRSTRQTLAQAERLSSLGALVESVTHEVSNPLGAGITASTHLEEATRIIDQKFRDNALSRADLSEYLNTARTVSELTARNLTRAAALIESFKQVAVDQTSDVRRPFDMATWLKEVQIALNPRLRRAGHTMVVTCAEGIVMDSRPGILFQVLTELTGIAQCDGLIPGKPGRIELTVRAGSDNKVTIVFRDNGRGLGTRVTEIFARPPSPLPQAQTTGPLAEIGNPASMDDREWQVLRALQHCRTLVNGPLMGGLYVRSALEQGTAVTLVLPRILEA